eukprot:7690326-Karenia_brevis.AAC.1
MMSTWRYNRPKDQDAPSEKAFHSYCDRVKRFFRVFNGGGGTHEGFPHYTRTVAVSRVDKTKIAAEMTASVKEVILPVLPMVPSGTKWTRLG